jgi:DNA-binding Lrp family transcriptional regulator
VRLEEMGVDAFDGYYAWYGAEAVRSGGDRLYQWLRLHTETEGMVSVFGRPWSLSDVEGGPLALLELSEGVCPEIEVVLTREWLSETRRDRRETLLAWIVEELAAVMNVRIVGTGYVQRRLVREHDAVLPTSVIEAVKSRLRDSRVCTCERECTCAPAEERAQTALDELSWDHPAWDVLDAIEQTAAERLPYSDLYSDIRFSDVSESGVRRRVKELRDLELVETVSISGERQVALLPPAGPALKRYREAYVQEVGPAPLESLSGGTERERLQSSCSECEAVSTPQQSHGGTVCSQTRTEGGGDVPSPASVIKDEASSTTAETHPKGTPSNGWLRADEHHGIAAAAANTDVVFSEHPVEKAEDPREYGVSYDDQRGEVVVSVEGDRRMVVTAVRLAAALVDDRLLSTALTSERLAGGIDRDGLDGLGESNPVVLRRARNVGYLPRESETANELRQRLASERQSLLAGLSTVTSEGDLTNLEAASELLQRAHGLMGTAAQLYDLLGIEVVRHIRLPEFSRNFRGSSEALAKFLSKGLSIGARDGHYVPERVLYEEDTDKREYILGTPNVDPRTPGEVVGSWVISGPGVHDLAEPLEEHLADLEEELQTEGEHFAPMGIDVEITQAYRREAVAETIARLGELKGLKATRGATSILYGLLGSIEDVAQAVYALGSEGIERELELGELRYALSTLPADRLLPEIGKPAVSKMVKALLEAERAVSKAELAERAGVSKTSVGRHREKLEAFGLLDVEETDAGSADAYRLRIPWRNRGNERERQAPRYFVENEQRNLQHAIEAAVTELGIGPLISEYPEIWQALDPGRGRGVDLGPVGNRWPWLRGWIDVISALLGGEVGSRQTGKWAECPYSVKYRLGVRASSGQLSLEESIGARGVG